MSRIKNDCELSEVCRSLDKFGITGNADWMSLVLFVRNSLAQLTVLSAQQKEAVQKRVFDEIDSKNFTKDEYLNILGMMEGMLEDNCARRMSAKKDAVRLEKAFSLLLHQELQESLSLAMDHGAKHTETVTGFGDRTVNALLSGEKREQIVSDVRGFVKSVIQDLEEEAKMWERRAKQLEIRAMYDPLLQDLYNRRALDSKLEELTTGNRSDQPVCLMMIDVDHFKANINDRLGHQTGDDVLKSLARIIKGHAADAGGFAARYGGEELVIIFEGMPLEKAVQKAEEIRLHVQQYRLHPKSASRTGVHSLQFTVSIGVAQLMPDWDVDQFIEAADSAMYEAKNSGRNRVRAFSE